MARMFTDILMFIFESFIIWYYSNTVFKSQLKKNISFIIILVGYTIVFGVYELGYTILNFVAQILINFLIFKLIYKCSLTTSIFHSIIFLTIMGSSELITMTLISAVFDQSINLINTDIKTYLFDVIISKLFYFIVCVIVMKTFVYRDNRKKIKKNYWLLFLMPLSCVFVMMVLRFAMYGLDFSKSYYILLCISTFLMLFSNVFVFYIYENSQKESQELYELKTLQQINELDTAYFKILEQSNKDMQVFAHDIKNHFTQIRNLDNMESVGEYIDKLYPKVEKFSSIGISKNKILDLIISKYSKLCESNHITFQFNVRTANLYYLDNTDLSSILNNLLDNAVDAAEKSEQRKIELDIFAKNRICDAVVIKNSCDIEPKIHGTNLLTTKQNKELHGIGLSSVLKTLKKYNAFYDWNYSKDTKQFETTIVFPKKEICDKAEKD